MDYGSLKINIKWQFKGFVLINTNTFEGFSGDKRDPGEQRERRRLMRQGHILHSYTLLHIHSLTNTIPHVTKRSMKE